MQVNPPMPGRSIVGGYRYAYQGQEKDAETGKEAFELRLWDSRIGRWLSPDPYGVHYSPYLGMANNPIGVIDRDGGIPIPIITGAIGAIINAGINIYSQAAAGELDFSSGKTWARIGVAAGGGFIAGSTGNIGAAVTANTLTDVADQLIVNDGDFSEINLTQSVVTGISTFVGGKSGSFLANKSSFIKVQSRQIVEKLHSSKFITYTGKTLYGTALSNEEIVNRAAAYTSELAGGLIAAPLARNAAPDTDYIKRFFVNKPNVGKLNSNLVQPLPTFNFFNNNRSSILTPSVEVGDGCFCRTYF